MKSIESTEDFSAALRIVVGGAYVDGLNDRPHSTEAVKCTVRLLSETDATLRSEVAALREALRSLARIETDEEGLPVLVISCGWHCQTSDQTELPLVWAALSRPALTGNGDEARRGE